MEVINSISLLLGSSWASGVNLYLTIAVLGIANRVGIIDLPGNMDALSNIFVISVAIILFLIEFFADKIPYVDSAWDSVHTFIRPAGGAIMRFLAMAEMGPAVQIPVALVTGAVALDSHATKATARVAINTSPEPVTNSVASVTEDGLVVGMLWLIFKHPVIAAILAVLFIIFSIWFLKVMFRFVKKVFKFLGGKKDNTDNQDLNNKNRGEE